VEKMNPVRRLCSAVTVFLLLLFSVYSGILHAQPRFTLAPTNHCRDFPANAQVTFADPDLEEVVRAALDLDAQQPLTCGRAAQLQELIVGSSIERVVYGGTLRPQPEKPFESLDGIQNLIGLTTLHLINRLITDLTPVGELRNLRNLNLHTNWFSDLEPLSELTALEELIVSENPISDISPLAGLTSLRRLQVHGLYPYQLQHYLNFNDGRDPDVVFNGITDISALAGLKEMRLLRIHLNAISDLSPLAGLSKLTHLRIYDNQIEDLSPLTGLNELVLLWAHNNRIRDIGALRTMTALQQLSLNDNAITDIGPLRPLINLEYLFLSNNAIADIAPLRRLHALQVLRLENNRIEDISALAGMINLRELSLARNWSLYDVGPLLLNAGIGQGDELDLRYTYVRCADMDAFAARGVNLLRSTVVNGSACNGRRLEDP
jgi:hypothetical protein